MAHGTVDLRGLEAICGVIPKYNCMVAHVMLLEGPMELLLTHLPLALARTFNKFPRMRLLQSSSNEMQAKWLPAQVTVDQILQQAYFQVVRVEAATSGEQANTRWQQVVQHQCEQLWDRTTKFPYYLHVLVDASTKNLKNLTQLRLVLYSDHYMSDATSGYIILDSILQEASQLTKSTQPSTTHEVNTSQQQPFPRSVYKICCVWTNWKSLVVWILVKLLVKPLVRMVTAAYQPLLPIEKSQKDFVIGGEAVQNKSFALFESGTKANLAKALAKCREEHVTLYGAFAACAVAACAEISGQSRRKAIETKDGNSPQFRMSLGFAYDARKRLSAGSLPPNAVGCYALSGLLESFSQQGVELATTRFWDLARRAKQETEHTISGIKSLVGLYMVDEMAKLIGLNRMPGFVFPRCINSDTIISNTGAYPFKTRHEFHAKDKALTGKTAWQIKSVFNYSCGPTMSSCCSIWITSVESLHYAMMYKIEHKTAAQYFATLVRCFESIGDIDKDETMDQVMRRILVNKTD